MSRFELARRHELVLQVNDVFSAGNRAALGRTEARIAAIPGVRSVVGPAGLLALSRDRHGSVSASPLFGAATADQDSEGARQRLARRSDAVGWFVDPDGARVRLLVDVDDPVGVRGAIESAVASSGLVLTSGTVALRPLWPDPSREPRPFPPWLPMALLALGMMVPLVGVARWARVTAPRVGIAFVATFAAGAAPLLLSPVADLRALALGQGLGAALLLSLALLGAHARPRATPSRLSPSLFAVLAAVALIGMLAGIWPRLSMGTHLWRQTSVFFVSVRGDLDEPIVLRELRRMTDHLRARRGVAHAWSIADLFFAVPVEGEEATGIPASPADVHAIFARARTDSAVRLELAADHREALIGVRLDPAAPVDPLRIVAGLERYLATDHRPAILRISTVDPSAPASARALAKGVLANNAREQILNVCARWGRNLDEGEILAIERVTRQAAAVPTAEPAKLAGEIATEAGQFLDELAAAEKGLRIAPAARGALLAALTAQPSDATVEDVLKTLARSFTPAGEALRPALEQRAAELHARLARVRRRHAARINFRELLYHADLPAEGILAEEVKSAIREAMGQVAGVPVRPETPGAFTLDAVPVGGAPSDRELSRMTWPRTQLGLAVALGIALLALAAVGGARALLWGPVAMAPAATGLLVPAVATVPVGVLFLSFVAGLSAGGVGLAVMFAPGRRDG